MSEDIAPHSLVSEATIAEIVDTARTCPLGCFVEVGVYKGGTAWFLSQLCVEQGRELYLYDTFTGIPHRDDGDSHSIGDFADTSYEEVRARIPHAITVQGIFPLSAVPMPPIAFAHLDCDQYRSVKESVEYLLPRMIPQGVIWFDDSPCLQGAKKAAEAIFGARLKLSQTGKHYVEV